MFFINLLLMIVFCQGGFGQGKGRGMGRGLGGFGNGNGRGSGKGKVMNEFCTCTFCQKTLEMKNEEQSILEHIKIDRVKECVSNYCTDDSCQPLCEERVDEILGRESCSEYCQTRSGRGCGMCENLIKNFKNMDDVYQEDCGANDFRPRCSKMSNIIEILREKKNCLDFCL